MVPASTGFGVGTRMPTRNQKRFRKWKQRCLLKKQLLRVGGGSPHPQHRGCCCAAGLQLALLLGKVSARSQSLRSVVRYANTYVLFS